MSSDATPALPDRSFVIATTNPGKRREFQQLLDDFLKPGWEIFDRQSFPGSLTEVEETGKTFVENAIKKAMETAKETGCCCLADDSGLEVDALDGAPGIYSARFAGDDADDEANNRLLVSKMRNVPEPERTARFVASLALVIPENEVGRAILSRQNIGRKDVPCKMPDTEAHPGRVDDKVVVWFRGTVEGMIDTEPKGDHGFGYDPHFHVPRLDKRMAEMTSKQKNQISHRAQAVRRLLKWNS